MQMYEALGERKSHFLSRRHSLLHQLLLLLLLIHETVVPRLEGSASDYQQSGLYQ